MNNFKDYYDFFALISREFLKKHKVYKYRTKKVEEMDDEQVISACHWYYEENNLAEEFHNYCNREWNEHMVRKYLGKTIHVTVDRPLGSHHPEHKNLVYPVNYGYFEGLSAPDGEWQDVYILCVYEAVNSFEGKVIAVIHRLDDIEDKWVVCPDEYSFTKEEVFEATEFQEKYYKIEILM